MTTDIERLREAASVHFHGFNSDRDDVEGAARDVVSTFLDILRTPSEPAALAGGNAAMEASMSFRPAAFCGLAAMQGTIDHIKAQAE